MLVEGIGAGYGNASVTHRIREGKAWVCCGHLPEVLGFVLHLLHHGTGKPERQCCLGGMTHGFGCRDSRVQTWSGPI